MKLHTVYQDGERRLAEVPTKAMLWPHEQKWGVGGALSIKMPHLFAACTAMQRLAKGCVPVVQRRLVLQQVECVQCVLLNYLEGAQPAHLDRIRTSL